MEHFIKGLLQIDNIGATIGATGARAGNSMFDVKVPVLMV
jgi:hypothetical protein